MIIPVLGANECRVWWADPRDHQITSLIPILSEIELDRAAGFHREDDRRRYVTACWLLRTTAGAQLGIAPEDVQIDRQCECGKPHGKPRIVSPGAPLEVSISHSGNRVAVALSTAGAVGVDVEEIAPDAGGIPELALSPVELKSLQELAEEERETGFLHMWIRKEAVLKATGHGLRIPPDQIEVSGPQDAPALLSWPLDIDPYGVRLHTLDPGEGYAGVIALLTDGRTTKISESTAGGSRGNDLRALASKAA